MGKRPGRDFRNKKRFYKKKRDDQQSNDKREDNFGEWVYTNEKFVRYYQSQGIVKEEEWEEFMKYLGLPLPTTFRINHSCAFVDRIREHIATDFKFDGLVVEGEEIEPITPMEWYPDRKAYQWSVERRKVRKMPVLSEFQKWLVAMSDTGSITRQEAVSMIPPLVLGVEPHHKVLDMCAAPGSKTSQLLESLHAQEHITGQVPTGMVVANDVDIKRAYMLVHQSKRINSPALLVTCHPAQEFPLLEEVGGSSGAADGVFDRILCDAPCSGDGTLRKNPIIWKQWESKNGLALHPLQLQIAKRGAQLLKIGGNMCYSTCSFNPLENEAVVAELLRWSQGSLELVDASQILPRLKRRQGMTNWKVMDVNMKEYDSFEQVEQQPKDKNKVFPTMFPPSQEEIAKFHLERCMRCVPQDENTGGFFICLLKKTGPTPRDEKMQKVDAKVEEVVEPKVESTETEAPVEAGEADVETAVGDGEEAPKKQSNRERRGRRRQPQNDDYVALPDDQFEKIRDFYQLDASRFPAKQLFTRSNDAKTVTFVSQSITAELVAQMKAKGLQVVYTGIKAFERNDIGNGELTYRLSQAGVHLSLPFMSSRIVRISTREFQFLLENHGKLLSFSDLDASTQQAFEEASVGSLVCCLDRDNQSVVEKAVMNIVVWRGRSSINVMTSKPDTQALLATMKELGFYHATERIVKEEQDSPVKKEEEAIAEAQAEATQLKEEH